MQQSQKLLLVILFMWQIVLLLVEFFYINTIHPVVSMRRETMCTKVELCDILIITTDSF